MKKAILFVGAFLALNTMAQDCSDLFISEYAEGWGNNKALEIYNPTGATIDLSQYFVTRYSNGSTTPSAQYSIQLVGTIDPYSTHVGVLDKQDPDGTGQEAPVWDSLAVKADAWYSPVYADNSTWYWNGNDAITLAIGNASDPSSGTLVDLFGKIGQDPENATEGTNGWSSVSPYNYTSGDPDDRVVTEDHSMIRKATVLVGKNNPVEVFDPGYEFDPLLEFDSIPAVIPRIDQNGDTVYQMDGVTPIWDGNWASLGEHECNCFVGVDEASLEKINIYPNPTSGLIYVNNVENVEKIEIFNTLGQTVKTINNKAKSVLKIQLGDNPGLYMMKFIGNDGTTSTKRVISK